ncbi:MAG TPA: DUF5670 family protein [Patescibacteria group bacterium]|jgi:hypothetical protein|nr:DUF5670 family protein [Patescibacteria group bacterium]
MFGVIAILLILLWAAGLAFHILGAFINVVLVLAVFFGILHLLKARKIA